VEEVVAVDALAPFTGRTVLVTGNTGFKGSWLSETLHLAGASVVGLSLPPPTQPALFDILGLAERVTWHVGDVRDAKFVDEIVRAVRPDYVFHLAAQPIVRLSYEVPAETFGVNVIGTVNVLDALRGADWPCAAVMVTTDKCYQTRPGAGAYRETDALGGHDPYSASKAAAELVIDAYRRSYFSDLRVRPVSVASARAGNVIGGGDWGVDRIVPDCVRHLVAGTTIRVRNPASTRPWQHVLEPLWGYLTLAAQLREAQAACLGSGTGASERLAEIASAFNFGPDAAAHRAVRDVVTEFLGHWPGRWEHRGDAVNAFHEASSLHLAIDRAREVLRWAPAWTFATAIEKTAVWYRRAAEDPRHAPALTRAQIGEYLEAATRPGRLPERT
jgi:CDP-glucose 4,6-dehydratase